MSVQMRCNWTWKAIDDLNKHTGLYRNEADREAEIQAATDKCVEVARDRGSNLVSRADVRKALG